MFMPEEGDLKWFDHTTTGWKKLDIEPVLHAYNINSWSSLGIIYLPQFAHLVVNQLWALIVSVADFELCLLWYGGHHAGPDTKELSPLYYAMVSICLDPMAPTATLLKEAVLGINAVEVFNCLPYDSVSDDDDHSHLMEEGSLWCL
ncbi:unnamed protein product [Cuscuta campestris]|uniref:Uncharacterized protein n=1 Tax=Cuscuta campestris TaxID=132261 RepID=A0A484MSC8_9ASTE|nr:unnamed protein product [Cuscuta campestris]